MTKLTHRQQRRAELAAHRVLVAARRDRTTGLSDPAARDRETKAAGLVKGETACNRSACQEPLTVGQRYWNNGTNAFYCKHCAFRINETNSNLCVLES